MSKRRTEKIPRKKKRVTAESIARLADARKDVSPFFANSGRVCRPPEKIHVILRRPTPEFVSSLCGCLGEGSSALDILLGERRRRKP